MKGTRDSLRYPSQDSRQNVFSHQNVLAALSFDQNSPGQIDIAVSSTQCRDLKSAALVAMRHPIPSALEFTRYRRRRNSFGLPRSASESTIKYLRAPACVAINGMKAPLIWQIIQVTE